MAQEQRPPTIDFGFRSVALLWAPGFRFYPKPYTLKVQGRVWLQPTFCARPCHASTHSHACDQTALIMGLHPGPLWLYNPIIFANIRMHRYIYIYLFIMYMYTILFCVFVCMYICVHTNTHTHIYIYIYICAPKSLGGGSCWGGVHTYVYIYIYVYVYAYVYVYVYVCVESMY